MGCYCRPSSLVVPRNRRGFRPSRQLVWHVTENHFNFIKDQSEWVGTDVVFDLKATGAGTELNFIHQGLLPSHECCEVCRDAWTGYLGGSLKDRIVTGTGQPTPSADFSVRVTLAVAPGTVMAAVDRPKAWWAIDIEGSVDRLGDEFLFRHKDLHRSVQKVTEKIPGRRAVWEVTESNITFVKNPAEWTGTRLVFEALPRDGGTELVFTQEGLNPSKDCYADCAEGWTYFIQDSLAALITTGQGKPDTAVSG